MTTQEAADFFGSRANLARALGISQPAVSSWGKFPPELRQFQIQAVSKNKLKAEPRAA